MPVIQVINKTPVVVSTLTTTTSITHSEKTVNQIVVNPTLVTVTPTPKTSVVVRALQQGPSGRDGADGGINSITVTVLHSALPGPITLGNGILNKKVLDVIATVKEAFEPGLLMTVGTDLAQAILMNTLENDLSSLSMYEKTVNYEYENTPEFKVFFIGGASATGEVEITISFT